MISVNLANKILEFITAKTNSISQTGAGLCYLGFSTRDPGSDGSQFAEPSKTTYPSYARIQLNVFTAKEYTDQWGPVADKSVELLNEIVSSECLEEGGWPTFTHFGIFNSKTVGSDNSTSLLAWDLLTDPDGEPDEYGQYPAKTLKVNKNEVAVFRTGSLKLTFK